MALWRPVGCAFWDVRVQSRCLNIEGCDMERGKGTTLL